MIIPPRGAKRVVRRILFTTADRDFARWTERIQVGQGAIFEQGVKQGDMVVCEIDDGGPNQRASKQKRLPKAISGNYIPRAMIALLPRLADLKNPQTYAFAAYAPSANTFDVYTFDIKGAEEISLNGAAVVAVHVVETVAEDADGADLWFDDQGVLLRLRSASGVVIQAARQQRVQANFPQAAELVRKFKMRKEAQ